MQLYIHLIFDWEEQTFFTCLLIVSDICDYFYWLLQWKGKLAKLLFYSFQQWMLSMWHHWIYLVITKRSFWQPLQVSHSPRDEMLVKVFAYGYLDTSIHDDVIKWKHFPRYWPFVRGIHRSPVNSPHKGQWRRALMFTLICVWINGCVNNREAGDLRRYCAHYGVTVMCYQSFSSCCPPHWITLTALWKHIEDHYKTKALYKVLSIDLASKCALWWPSIVRRQVTCKHRVTK